MLKHNLFKNKDVVTKFGTIHFNENGESTDLNATQEAEFQGVPNYLVSATTTTTTTLVVGKKTKEVEKQMEETTTSTTKKPRKKKTAPKKSTK